MLDELQDPAFGFHARVLGDEVVAELRVLLVQPQQRAHERRVSGVSIRLGMRAAPAVRQWPAGRLVKAPQQPLQAVGRRGGGGVCVRGKRGVYFEEHTLLARAERVTSPARAERALPAASAVRR